MMRVHTRVVWQWRDGALVELPEEGESYEYEGPVALAGAGTPVSRITNYRGRSDTGTVDASPTFITTENTAFSVSPGTAFRIRIGVENTGTASDTIISPAASAGNGISRCGYTDVAFGTVASSFNGADAGSSADAANIATQRLTSGTGTFATATNGYDENETISCAVANGNFTEVEFGVVLTGGTSTVGVGGGETWTFGVGGLTNAAANLPTFTTPEQTGSDFQPGAQLGGAGQLVANSASISMTTAAAASAGNLVVVTVCCDNNSSSNGDFSEISGVTIGGNAATKAVELTSAGGAAQAGCTVSIWYLQLAGNLASSSTITASFTTATTSGDANAIQAREFVVASGKTVSVEAINSVATAAGSLQQPTALDATTSNIECLRVCANAIEGGSITQLNVLASNSNWSLWWTAGALERTSGSASAIHSITEARISTGTGAVSQIGAVSGGDHATAYVAFRADAGADFEDGAAAATGTGTATLVGASTAVAVASATGTGTATLASSADDTKPFSMTGTGTATLVGASQADSLLSATGTGTATFVGLTLVDAVLSATGTGAATFVSSADDTKPFSMTGTGTATLVGASQADSVLSATGTGTASLVGGPLSDGVLAATGTATANFVAPAADTEGALAATGTVTAAFVGDYDAFNCGLVLNDGTSFVLLSDASSVLLLNDDSCLAPPSPYSTAVLSATGTGTALLVGASQADSVLAATGTGTATLVGASTADSTLSATGTATVSFVGAATADSILAATGTATVSWSYASEGDGALNVTATGDAALVGASDADSVLSATGTATADFVGEGVQAATDAVLDATGTGTASFVGEDATPAVVETPAALTGGGAGTWSKRKKRKKKDALNELDELLVAVSAQIAPWSAAKAYETEQALYRSVLERGKHLDESDTLARIEAEVVNLKELLAEMDDEEALLLLM
jgi:hypothetical protein